MQTVMFKGWRSDSMFIARLLMTAKN